MTKVNSNQPISTNNHVHSSTAVPTTNRVQSPHTATTYQRTGHAHNVTGAGTPPRASVTRAIEGTSQAGHVHAQARASAHTTQHPELNNVREGNHLVRRGADGPQVEALQKMLNRSGANPPLATDGQFGPLTQSAVREFQAKHGLQVDGIVGPKTMGALDRAPHTAPANPGHTHGTHGPNAPSGNHTHSHGTSQADAYDHGRNIGRIDVTHIDGKPVESRTARAFEDMRAAAARDGVNIRIRSGFRSNAEQAELYRRYQNGTGNLAAPPGHSNHQNGRALDLNTEDSSVLNWLNRNGSRFGFARTVPSEPWHWEHRH